MIALVPITMILSKSKEGYNFLKLTQLNNNRVLFLFLRIYDLGKGESHHRNLLFMDDLNPL